MQAVFDLQLDAGAGTGAIRQPDSCLASADGPAFSSFKRACVVEETGDDRRIV
jgi:hypothetical protein